MVATPAMVGQPTHRPREKRAPPRANPGGKVKYLVQCHLLHEIQTALSNKIWSRYHYYLHPDEITFEGIENHLHELGIKYTLYLRCRTKEDKKRWIDLEWETLSELKWDQWQLKTLERIPELINQGIIKFLFEPLEESEDESDSDEAYMARLMQRHGLADERDDGKGERLASGMVAEAAPTNSRDDRIFEIENEIDRLMRKKYPMIFAANPSANAFGTFSGIFNEVVMNPESSIYYKIDWGKDHIPFLKKLWSLSLDSWPDSVLALLPREIQRGDVNVIIHAVNWTEAIDPSYHPSSSDGESEEDSDSTGPDPSEEDNSEHDIYHFSEREFLNRFSALALLDSNVHYGLDGADDELIIDRDFKSEALDNSVRIYLLREAQSEIWKLINGTRFAFPEPENLVLTGLRSQIGPGMHLELDFSYLSEMIFEEDLKGHTLDWSMDVLNSLASWIRDGLVRIEIETDAVGRRLRDGAIVWRPRQAEQTGQQLQDRLPIVRPSHGYDGADDADSVPEDSLSFPIDYNPALCDMFPLLCMRRQVQSAIYDVLVKRYPKLKREDVKFHGYYGDFICEGENPTWVWELEFNKSGPINGLTGDMALDCKRWPLRFLVQAVIRIQDGSLPIRVGPRDELHLYPSDIPRAHNNHAGEILANEPEQEVVKPNLVIEPATPSTERSFTDNQVIKADRSRPSVNKPPAESSSRPRLFALMDDPWEDQPSVIELKSTIAVMLEQALPGTFIDPNDLGFTFNNTSVYLRSQPSGFAAHLDFRSMTWFAGLPIDRVPRNWADWSVTQLEYLGRALREGLMGIVVRTSGFITVGVKGAKSRFIITIKLTPDSMNLDLRRYIYASAVEIPGTQPSGSVLAKPGRIPTKQPTLGSILTDGPLPTPNTTGIVKLDSKSVRPLSTTAQKKNATKPEKSKTPEARLAAEKYKLFVTLGRLMEAKITHDKYNIGRNPVLFRGRRGANMGGKLVKMNFEEMKPEFATEDLSSSADGWSIEQLKCLYSKILCGQITPTLTTVDYPGPDIPSRRELKAAAGGGNNGPVASSSLKQPTEENSRYGRSYGLVDGADDSDDSENYESEEDSDGDDDDPGQYLNADPSSQTPSPSSSKGKARADAPSRIPVTWPRRRNAISSAPSYRRGVMRLKNALNELEAHGAFKKADTGHSDAVVKPPTTSVAPNGNDQNRRPAVKKPMKSTAAKGKTPNKSKYGKDGSFRTAIWIDKGPKLPQSYPWEPMHEDSHLTSLWTGQPIHKSNYWTPPYIPKADDEDTMSIPADWRPIGPGRWLAFKVAGTPLTRFETRLMKRGKLDISATDEGGFLAIGESYFPHYDSTDDEEDSLDPFGSSTTPKASSVPPKKIRKTDHKSNLRRARKSALVQRSRIPDGDNTSTWDRSTTGRLRSLKPVNYNLDRLSERSMRRKRTPRAPVHEIKKAHRACKGKPVQKPIFSRDYTPPSAGVLDTPTPLGRKAARGKDTPDSKGDTSATSTGNASEFWTPVYGGILKTPKASPFYTPGYGGIFKTPKAHSSNANSEAPVAGISPHSVNLWSNSQGKKTAGRVPNSNLFSSRSSPEYPPNYNGMFKTPEPYRYTGIEDPRHPNDIDGSPLAGKRPTGTAMNTCTKNDLPDSIKRQLADLGPFMSPLWELSYLEEKLQMLYKYLIAKDQGLGNEVSCMRRYFEKNWGFVEDEEHKFLDYDEDVFDAEEKRLYAGDFRAVVPLVASLGKILQMINEDENKENIPAASLVEFKQPAVTVDHEHIDSALGSEGCTEEHAKDIRDESPAENPSYIGGCDGTCGSEADTKIQQSPASGKMQGNAADESSRLEESLDNITSPTTSRFGTNDGAGTAEEPVLLCSLGSPSKQTPNPAAVTKDNQLVDITMDDLAPLAQSTNLMLGTDGAADNYEPEDGTTLIELDMHRKGLMVSIRLELREKLRREFGMDLNYEDVQFKGVRNYILHGGIIVSYTIELPAVIDDVVVGSCEASQWPLNVLGKVHDMVKGGTAFIKLERISGPETSVHAIDGSSSEVRPATQDTAGSFFEDASSVEAQRVFSTPPENPDEIESSDTASEPETSGYDYNDNETEITADSSTRFLLYKPDLNEKGDVMGDGWIPLKSSPTTSVVDPESEVLERIEGLQTQVKEFQDRIERLRGLDSRETPTDKLNRKLVEQANNIKELKETITQLRAVNTNVRATSTDSHSQKKVQQDDTSSTQYPPDLSGIDLSFISEYVNTIQDKDAIITDLRNIVHNREQEIEFLFSKIVERDAEPKIERAERIRVAELEATVRYLTDKVLQLETDRDLRGAVVEKLQDELEECLDESIFLQNTIAYLERLAYGCPLKRGLSLEEYEALAREQYLRDVINSMN